MKKCAILQTMNTL